jgi:hypothetical protein
MLRPQADMLVMYLSSPSSYGIRFQSSPELSVIVNDTAIKPAITSAECDELAALRKAQAWETPMFQPRHPRYAAAIARLRQLEAKELASGSAGSPRSRACVN